MPQGPESLQTAASGTVDPLLLAIVCLIFVIGAVVPIAAAILSSLNEDRQAKRAAVADQQVSNPVAENVMAAVDVVELEPIAPETIQQAANDDPQWVSAHGAR
ncbi:MAG: hypothetical protein NXI18_06670 [Alphaproteobacteria bacterium]|nr:hypothetical protein [Alphaproteobacteria bacterium]